MDMHVKKLRIYWKISTDKNNAKIFLDFGIIDDFEFRIKGDLSSAHQCTEIVNSMGINR